MLLAVNGLLTFVHMVSQNWCDAAGVWWVIGVMISSCKAGWGWRFINDWCSVTLPSKRLTLMDWALR